MKAMIFAAGLGSRLKPITDSIPKAMVSLGKITAIEFAIKKMLQTGIRDIVINVHHHHEILRAYLAENKGFGANIMISDESELLLDTGGGLRKAAHLLQGSEAVVVYNCDIVSNINLSAMLAFHHSVNALCTVAVRNRKTSRYLLFNKANELCGWQNTKTGETIYCRTETESLQPLAFSGIHVFSQEALAMLPDDKVYSLIPFYLKTAEDHRIGAYQHDNDIWFDIGKPETLAEVQKIEAEKFFQ